MQSESMKITQALFKIKEIMGKKTLSLFFLNLLIGRKHSMNYKIKKAKKLDKEAVYTG